MQAEYMGLPFEFWDGAQSTDNGTDMLYWLLDYCYVEGCQGNSLLWMD